jgi:ribosome-associated protein
MAAGFVDSKFIDSKFIDSKFVDSKMADSNLTDALSASIKLDQFLKLQGLVGTGGQAKLLIQDGSVFVNGTVETRRGRKLTAGDRISIEGQTYTVDASILNG